MTQQLSPEAIFEDARDVYAQALERLEAGDIRDAAEKAWCATLRATDALILARTGKETETSRGTSQELRMLIHADNRVSIMRAPFYQRQRELHGDCFYYGLCEPLEETAELIRDTNLYLAEAERLAYS